MKYSTSGIFANTLNKIVPIENSNISTFGN